MALYQPTAIDDPWTVVKEYRKAAYKAKAAGFDGVERKLSLFSVHL